MFISGLQMQFRTLNQPSSPPSRKPLVDAGKATSYSHHIYPATKTPTTRPHLPDYLSTRGTPVTIRLATVPPVKESDTRQRRPHSDLDTCGKIGEPVIFIILAGHIVAPASFFSLFFPVPRLPRRQPSNRRSPPVPTLQPFRRRSPPRLPTLPSY